MKKEEICRGWKLILQDRREFPVHVPGSLYSGLLENHQIEDPYYRENEYDACELAAQDCMFRNTFDVPEKELNSDEILLVFHGVDTLADIWLNGTMLGSCANMHCTYRFNVKDQLRAKGNLLEVRFSSALRFARESYEKNPVWGCSTEETIPGYQHIRKCHSMFGWDWGPKLPDMGIFRPCELWFSDAGRMEDVYVQQRHADGSVDLTVQTETVSFGEEPLYLRISLEKDGEVLEIKEIPAEQKQVVFHVESPELWWPHGYGEQPLYQVRVCLMTKEKELECREQTIGLRTLTVSRKPDRWGEEFCFVINGKKIFSMGADYIPEDSILAFTSPERTERLIQDCIKANFNTIRVWGGGYYPEDWFYDLCDRYGLLVWQDFMFACAVYDLTEEFRRSITQEFTDNLIRLRNHPSLALLCGNNEMEYGWVDWNLPDNEKLRQDYIEMNERLIPELCRTYTPDVFYWPSSPSSGGGFDDPNSDNRGDVHYWEVWHSNKPFEEYRKHYFRFCSEFGFESFPDLKTIESFTLPEDRNILSPVLESHQKRQGCNSKILNYITQHYLYPKNLEMLVYASQLIQADAMRYGVEHWRRYRGRCMGAIYWQLNDCWPVASWSSIDYFGRWKALHYYAKRFFAPVMLSLHGEGSSCIVCVSNETLKNFSGKVKIQVKDLKEGCLMEQTIPVSLEELTSEDIISADVSEFIFDRASERSRYLFVSLMDEKGEVIQSTGYTICRIKHFSLQKPHFEVSCRDAGDNFELLITSDTFAKSVRLASSLGDLCFSDNYFDCTDGEVCRITVEKGQLASSVSAEELKESLTLISVYDIA